MNKTEDILERLKGQMPQVPDSDFLTENIMQTITKAENGKQAGNVPVWVNIMRVVTSVAAMFFLALFIGLNGSETDYVAESSGDVMQMSVPVIKDKTEAIKLFNDRIEKRRARQIRQTQIKNLYAKF